MPRTREEKARAIARVVADGAVPMSDLVAPLGADVPILIRWSIKGRAGVHLDAVLRNGNWLSSHPAAARFLAELGEKRLTEPRKDGPAPAQGPHFMAAAARVTSRPASSSHSPPRCGR